MMEVLDKIDPSIFLLVIVMLVFLGGILSAIVLFKFEKVSVEKGKGVLKIVLTRELPRD